MSATPNLYQVESIVGHRKRKGKDFYLVHWLGYSKKEDSWEPEENLVSCTELIDNFMEETLAKERRKSLRTHESTKDVSLFSSDDETSITGPTKRKSLRRSPAQKKGAKSPTKKPIEVELVRKYNLRSLELSSEDDSKAVVSMSHKSSAARMTLSESRFRKQLTDIAKGIFSSPQHSTSTPQKAGSKSPSTKSKSKAKIKFESAKRTDSSFDQQSPMVTTQDQDLEEENQITIEATMVAEADDEGDCLLSSTVVKKTAKRESSPETKCFPITWREFALAAFVTGVGAVGYVCYATDYCNYC